MPFFTPALVGGIASAIGAIGSGFLGYHGQAQANQANLDIAQQTNAANAVAAGRAMDFSAEQAEKNRQFQERLSSTAWQRGVADMRKAGINPILAASQGGASTPSGSAPSGQAVGAVTGAPMMNKFNRSLETFNSAVQANASVLQLKLLKEQIEDVRNSAWLKATQSGTVLQDGLLKSNNAKVAAQVLRNLRLEEAGKRVESEIDSSDFGKATRYLERINPFAHTASALKHAFKAPMSITKNYTFKR